MYACWLSCTLFLSAAQYTKAAVTLPTPQTGMQEAKNATTKTRKTPSHSRTVNFACNDTRRGIRKVSLFAKCPYTRSLIVIMCHSWMGLCSGHGNSVVIRELSLYPQLLLAKLTVLGLSPNWSSFLTKLVLFSSYKLLLGSPPESKRDLFSSHFRTEQCHRMNFGTNPLHPYLSCSPICNTILRRT